MEILASCSDCSKPLRLKYGSDRIERVLCPSCSSPVLKYPTDSFLQDSTLHQCPLCGCAHLYRQKDFNQKIGLILIALGIGLSFFTYGLSLIIVTFLDWWLYRRVQEIGSCYQCNAIFRDSPKVKELLPFNLELHDYYRSITAN